MEITKWDLKIYQAIFFLVMFSFVKFRFSAKNISLLFSYYKSTPRGSMSSYTHGYSDSKCSAKQSTKNRAAL